jgi:hypothetical protein
VDADGADRLKVFYDLHGLIWVDVLFAHKPAWCVGADGNERKVGPAQPGAHLPKDLSIAIAGVAGEVGAPPVRMQHEPGPERHAPVADSVRRPMISGDDRHFPAPVDIDGVPPIAGLHAHAGNGPRQDRVGL